MITILEEAKNALRHFNPVKLQEKKVNHELIVLAINLVTGVGNIYSCPCAHACVALLLFALVK